MRRFYEKSDLYLTNLEKIESCFVNKDWTKVNMYIYDV